MNQESLPTNTGLPGATNPFNAAAAGRLPLPAVAGICFSLTGILAVLGSILLSKTSLSMPVQLMINEIGIILLPTLLILFLSKHNVKDVLRLNKPRISEVLLSIAFPIILFPALIFLAAVVLVVVEALFGSIDVSVLDPLSGVNIVIVILCAAILPGICEEVLFRGLVLKGLQKNGIIFGIILSSVLFGLFHMDFQRFIAQAVLGAVAGIVVYRTNSIFCGMIVHFVNNAMSLLISFFTSGGNETAEASARSMLEVLRTQAESLNIDFAMMCIMTIIIYLIIAVFFIALSLPLFVVLFKVTKEKVKSLGMVKQPIKPVHYLTFAPGLLIIAGVYCLTALYLWGLS